MKESREIEIPLLSIIHERKEKMKVLGFLWDMHYIAYIAVMIISYIKLEKEELNEKGNR